MRSLRRRARRTACASQPSSPPLIRNRPRSAHRSFTSEMQRRCTSRPCLRPRTVTSLERRSSRGCVRGIFHQRPAVLRSTSRLDSDFATNAGAPRTGSTGRRWEKHATISLDVSPRSDCARPLLRVTEAPAVPNARAPAGWPAYEMGTVTPFDEGLRSSTADESTIRSTPMGARRHSRRCPSPRRCWRCLRAHSRPGPSPD